MAYHRKGGHDGRSLAVRPTVAGQVFQKVHEARWAAELDELMEGNTESEDDDYDEVT